MITFITIWIISGILAAVILLFDPQRKEERRTTNISFTRSYLNTLKREFGPKP